MSKAIKAKSTPTAPSTGTAIRVSADVLTRIDAYRAACQARTGAVPSRVKAVEMLLQRGLKAEKIA